MSVRTVSSPDSKREGLAVYRLCILIAVLAWLSSGLHAGSDSEFSLRPWQISFHSLNDNDQGIYRDLEWAIDEMYDLRRGQDWNTAEELTEEGLPPFTRDYSTIRRGDHRWTTNVVAGVTRYFGRPEDSKATAWLLEVRVGDPSEADPAHRLMKIRDGEHRRMADGNILHAYFWVHPMSPGLAPPKGAPGVEEWKQIAVPPPSETQGK